MRRDARTGQRLWRLKCEAPIDGGVCGKRYTASTGTLTSGNTKSCGCQKHKGHKPKDHEGETFADGNITAHSFSHMDRHRKAWWSCTCNLCNRTFKASANQLVRGRVKSCGCLHKLTKARAKLEHKEIVRDEQGVPHYAPRLAARLLNVSITTFYSNKRRPGWKNSCPFNNEQGLPTKPLPNALGRRFDHFHGPTIDRVKESIIAAPAIPVVPGYYGASSK